MSQKIDQSHLSFNKLYLIYCIFTLNNVEVGPDENTPPKNEVHTRHMLMNDMIKPRQKLNKIKRELTCRQRRKSKAPKQDSSFFSVKEFETYNPDDVSIVRS